MHRATVDTYDDRGLDWAATHRTPGRPGDAERFADKVGAGILRLDLGCGAGRYTDLLGQPVVGLDASAPMLDECRSRVPDALYLQGDIEALPLARGSLSGAWSWMTHHHIARDRLPMALWDLHRVLAVGAPFDLQVLHGDYEGSNPGDDEEEAGRFFASWTPDRLVEVMVGAGFDVEEDSVVVSGDELRLSAVRARTLADTVGPGMRLLMCGSNPSFYSADANQGYFKAGNRFWKAALASGLVTKDRDSLDALRAHGMGMTDLVKRPTRAADEVTADEYRRGLGRLERLVEWLQPKAVCLVGLGGWRVAADPRAQAGLQETSLGGRPVYVMPSTSGLNARTSVDQLTDHLRAAMTVADQA
ncbi:MAG TPA: uracil-DNA glycosylase family protein [Acidimicrobiales bacterium]|nr:uracil-DNA glycosylase family protein [Acidimicrobiales bacterium]